MRTCETCEHNRLNSINESKKACKHTEVPNHAPVSVRKSNFTGSNNIRTATLLLAGLQRLERGKACQLHRQLLQSNQRNVEMLQRPEPESDQEA